MNINMKGAADEPAGKTGSRRRRAGTKRWTELKKEEAEESKPIWRVSINTAVPNHHHLMEEEQKKRHQEGDESKKTGQLQVNGLTSAPSPDTEQKPELSLMKKGQNYRIWRKRGNDCWEIRHKSEKIHKEK